MIRLPYGISAFITMVDDGYHYVDRTAYIARLEERNERYVFFLRPRRFGKTLFVSMLQHYYGQEFARDFQRLFGRYAIGQQPTPLANDYLVLKLDFSGINTDTAESTHEGFLANIHYGISIFLAAYASYFNPEDRAYILAAEAPNLMLIRLFERFQQQRIVQDRQDKIYILIDEYDHFANELLAFRFEEFKSIVSRNGFVRKFYEVIKTATAAGVVDRLFATGVSPLTLDSLTSGFNIALNLSTEPALNGMMGFTATETATILQGIKIPAEAQPEMMAAIHQWYNGYLFHPRATERIFNPDMLLYFANEYVKGGNYPDRMLDPNVASDYGKIRRLFRINDQEAQNLAVMNEIILTGKVAAALTAQYSLEKAFTRDDFVSLLFYMGMVTVGEEQLGQWDFVVPNEVINQLYYQYFNQVLLERADLVADDLRLREKVIKLAQGNNIAPLVEVVESILRQLSNRDAIGFDEKYLKAIIASLFYTTQIYMIHSEYELERKYVDLLLTRRPPLVPNYQFAFELKYLKQTDAGKLTETTKEGRTQLHDYLRHEKLRALTNLRGWLLVFVGTEAKVVEELPVASAP